MDKKMYKLMNWPEIEGIVYSEFDNPHSLLGAHITGNHILIQAFQPDALHVTIIDQTSERTFAMELVDEGGFYAALIPGKELFAYHYLVEYKDRTSKIVKDPYNFEPIITLEDIAKFDFGIHYTVYDLLGAHVRYQDGVKGVHFAVWAPAAIRVSVVGDFNHWDGRIHPMRRLWNSGIFEIFLPDVCKGDHYKFELKIKGGLTYLKADPYAFSSQLRPDTASIITDFPKFKWEDKSFIQNRSKMQHKNAPIHVYELYLGSFAKPMDGREYYNYRELAPKIINYVKEMGYTHIELMPIMEHPYDASWGYQVIGYYSPTARYGTPEDFMFFINEMHKASIGVILDWVPAHFPRDTYGLSDFDGTCLYEHMDPRQGSHPHWGTLIFNYGRPEVSNYLIANALFWIEKYHLDGIRMDAVASMLYLDYGKNDGEWVANMYGGNENLEAAEFLKHLNSIIKKRNKGVITIAEESTAWPMISGDLEEGGLGFDFKWNMGFMNDYLAYIKYDPYFRSHHHNELTFSMIYMYSEKFMLVFSHDEVVHGKGSMMGKMPGDLKDKFSNLRLTYGYMMMHPGKKLLFMGQDIAELEEWNETREVKWELLQYTEHAQFQLFVKKLSEFYKSHPALYELDADYEGFEWINSMLAKECVLSFLRKGTSIEDNLLIVCNFAGKEWANHKIGVPNPGKYIEILNSNEKEYGGTGSQTKKIRFSEEEECDGREDSIKVNIAPLSIAVYSYIPFTDEEWTEIADKKAEQVRKEEERKAQKAKEVLEKSKLKLLKQAEPELPVKKKITKKSEITK